MTTRRRPRTTRWRRRSRRSGQQRRVDADLAAAEALDLAGFTRLSAEEAQAEVHSPTYLGALREEHCGVLHAAKLAHGLARVVEGMGTTIFEGTDVTSIDDADGRIRVATRGGEVLANQVVLATNAFAAHTPWFRTKVVRHCCVRAKRTRRVPLGAARDGKGAVHSYGLSEV